MRSTVRLAIAKAGAHAWRVARGHRPAFLGCLVAGGLLACGPSVQSIYEGNVRFEHCYRLDLDLDIAPTHREACWRQWVKAYTYAQPRDRIEYSRRRIRAFAAGDLSRPVLHLDTPRRAEDRQFYLSVPSPVSPHAPPPPIATPSPKAVAVTAAEGGAAPGAGCASSCSGAWNSCKAACSPESSASEVVCASCEPDYKACMKRCFE